MCRLSVGVVVPCELLTYGLGLGVVCAVENGEVQGVSTWTAVRVCVLICVYAGFRVGVVVPCELLTGGLGLGVVRPVEDGEVQSVGA